MIGASTGSVSDKEIADFSARIEIPGIRQLPAVYREALLLVGVEGLRANQAAAICGVTPEAMRQRISRGRALLARGLEDQETPLLLKLKAVTP